MPSKEPNGRETFIAAVLAIVFGIGAFFFSLAAVADILSVPAIALVLTAIHYIAVTYVFRRTKAPMRWSLMVISFPLAILSIDSLGRLSNELGGPLFSILG